MARRCDISGKGVLTGNNVSHAHNKTRRRFLPNVQKMTLFGDTLGPVRLKLATSTLRSIENSGGLEAYLLKTPDRHLAPTGVKIKKRLIKAQAAKAAA